MKTKTPQFRYPDAPKPGKPMAMKAMKEGDWIAQHKYAGWRCLIRWDGKAATFTSREQKPIKVEAEVAAEVAHRLCQAGGTQLVIDAEYTGHIDNQEPSLIAFDLIEEEGWIGDRPLTERLARLFAIMNPQAHRRIFNENTSFRMAQSTLCEFESFYGSTKVPGLGLEGVVCKRMDSTLIGDTKRQAVNPAWIKIKHREGVPNKSKKPAKKSKPTEPPPEPEEQHIPATTPRPAAATPAPTSTISPSLLPFTVEIDSIKPDPQNARKHPKWNVDDIKRSLERWGQQRPILIDAARIIRAGNGTWAAAKALGWTHIAAVVTNLEGDDLTAYAIADNKTGESSVWDDEQLAKALSTLAPELSAAAGFNEKDLAALLGDPASTIDKTEPEEAGDGTPPESEKGDLWTMGEHKLLVGSATDPQAWQRLLGKATAALVFTDPPYGVDYESSKGESVQGDKRTDDDLLRLLVPAFKLAAAHADDTAAFYIWHASSTRRDFEHAMTAAGLTELQYIIWTKPDISLGRADYQWAHEPCFYASKSGSRPNFYGDRTHQTVWRMMMRGADEVGVTAAGGVTILDGQGGSLFITNKGPKGKKSRKLRLEEGQKVSIVAEGSSGTVWEVSREAGAIHPNQKPVALAAKAIENSSLAGQLVVDPFMGSGTTIIACEMSGRRAAGFEIDPKYADRIVRRWEAITKGKATRVDANSKPKPGLKV